MKFIEKILMPHLDWIQIEVSGLCNASCFYCPHTTHRKLWKGKNMSLEEFLKIKPYLKKVGLLYLQGWGEPFCNPDFFKFVEIGKKSGCKVGTTTNGMLIEQSHIEKIIELQMDVIAFSLTGIKKNDILRAGTKIDRVFKVISELNEMKIKKETSNPKIHIAYMLLRSNLDELEEIPKHLSSLGIDHIVISLLDFIPDSSLENESLIPKTEEDFNFLKDLASNFVKEAKKFNLSVSFNIPHPFKKGKTCSEKPLNAVFINSLGYVSPCVFTGIPAEGFKNTYFGNINERTLPSLWKSSKDFRKKFISDNSSLPCYSCPKRRIVEF
ncbi:radical SAM additional 4Fe4S-binding SPASM domain-containing protein [Thermodesulfovibrio aggregans]|uniref:Radical SAM additional 4Fe4S-binding SPASM domain-containing protein n=1 Tax=Thermodesulfovibrio aggregans TaxID=86166 RepID=A0A0U9HPM9_9BACT|nr:radical SAM protein [Thermodesulfovibrio aggregans]GAQ94988.1 radical SAM additional 4Fe4S-binding SPASM domain-containing protein [Thermodesulfovibrio aggregans]